MRSGPGLYIRRVLILRVFNTNETMQCLYTHRRRYIQQQQQKCYIVDLVVSRSSSLLISCVFIDSEWDSHLLYSCWNIIQRERTKRRQPPAPRINVVQYIYRLHYYYYLIIIVVQMQTKTFCDESLTIDRREDPHCPSNISKRKIEYLLISLFFQK